MKQFALFTFFMALFAGGAWGHSILFPPPPADYEIVYFGSTTCGACHHWKRNDLVSWRQDPASRSATLHLADLPGGRGAWTGGYGQHHATFMDAFGKRRSISWPSFVLLNHGEVVDVRTGARGFRSITNKVRREHERAARRAAQEAAV
ncbi:MAG: hypothetical protein AAF829_01880 [Pseudomonadota bacterium]